MKKLTTLLFATILMGQNAFAVQSERYELKPAKQQNFNKNGDLLNLEDGSRFYRSTVTDGQQQQIMHTGRVKLAAPGGTVTVHVQFEEISLSNSSYAPANYEFIKGFALNLTNGATESSLVENRDFTVARGKGWSVPSNKLQMNWRLALPANASEIAVGIFVTNPLGKYAAFDVNFQHKKNLGPQELRVKIKKIEIVHTH